MKYLYSVGEFKASGGAKSAPGIRGCFSLSLSISKCSDESERDVFVKYFVPVLSK